MATFDYKRKYAEVSVKGRSNFDLSHKNLLTTKCGTLTPVLTEEMIPGETVHLQAAINASLPPLASESYMNVNLELNAFFVPTRILYSGFESWLTKEPLYNSTGGTLEAKLPYMTITSAASNLALTTAGTLCDYLGVKALSGQTVQDTCKFNIFPFLAYHKIWDDHYRNTVVQKSCFARPIASSAALSNLPWAVKSSMTPYNISASLQDGVKLGELRQRNFDLDRFTSCMPSAQRGEAEKVNMTVIPPGVDENSATTSFSIKALRVANQLQIWAEKNQFSYKLQDYVKCNYGAHLTNGVAQRSLWLGRQMIEVYSKGVEQTAPSTQDSDMTSNPFGNVGAQYGRAVCVGEGTLIDKFTADEPGYLMVIACLVPKVTYGSGIRRYLKNYTEEGSQVDMPNANLQGTGNEPVYVYELSTPYGFDRPDDVFGYNDKYSWIMDHPDELHGLVRDGYSLQSFALQRSLKSSDSFDFAISDSFLKIPTSYLDQVAAATNTISDYGCWMDCYFNFKAVMPLAAYSIPSLEDPAREHGKKVKIKKGGDSVY